MNFRMTMTLMVAFGCGLYCFSNATIAQEAKKETKAAGHKEVLLELEPVISGNGTELILKQRLKGMDGGIEALDAAIIELRTKLELTLELREKFAQELGIKHENVLEIEANLNQLDVKLTELKSKRASLEVGKVGLKISNALKELDEALSIVESSGAADDEKLHTFVVEWKQLADKVKSEQNEFVLYWEALAEAPRVSDELHGDQQHYQLRFGKLLEQKKRQEEAKQASAAHTLILAQRGLELQKAAHLHLTNQFHKQNQTPDHDEQQASPLDKRFGELESRLERIEKLLEKSIGDKSDR